MRPPRRKAAVETQRRVTALLVNHAEIDGIPSDAEVIVASDHEFDKELTMEAVMPNRGDRKKRNAKYVYEQSHVITETTVNQNNMFESDIGDSDFEAEMQTSDDRDADLSSGEEIIVSSDKETKNKRKGSKPVKNARRSKKLRKQKEKKPLNVEDGVADDLNWQVWEKGLEDWEPWAGNGELDLDAFAQKKGPMEEQEPPPEMLMPLLPFQKEWLAWSLKQEESEFKGGILADEMGMGKTIQAISLFLCSRDLRLKAPLIANSSKLSNIEVGSTSKSKVLPQIKTTLVVCPMVAVIQWRNEIARFTSEGSTKVLIYHGANRCKDIAELSDYDIVLTTYNIIESEHRKKMMPGKERCQWCCKLFYPERLGIHQRYFCGPFAVKSEKQSKQVKKNGKQAVYGKTSKKKTIDEERNDKDVDVSKGKMKGKGKSKVSKIIKSAMDGNKNKNADLDDSEESGNKLPGSSNDMGPSVLHSVKWDRIILDEAHFIKDRTCSTAKAVFSLESSYKWALSGTPLQNRVGELYSLVRFLQIYPYSYYHCKKCNCKSLDYRFGKDGQKCDDCGHSAPQHFCWWNKFVANPIKKWGYTNYGHKALILLKYKILNSIVLRRTKIERAADLALPPRIAFLRRDAFDAREQDFYEALYTQSQSQFNTYITAGTLLNNYAHIFDLLTRLRQAVDHPYLVVYSKTAQSNPNNQNGAYDLSSGKSDCGLCHEVSDDMVSATCGHTFCKGCIEEYISTTGQSSCPSCLEPLTIDLTGRKSTNKVKGYKSSSILNRINLDDFQTSTKIDALREEIMLMLQKDAAAKAIVFSQFTSFLDLIKFCLQKSGTKCVQLDGSMSIQARDQTIEKFTNDPDCKIFLMSLKAGGVALNLTVASHVFLMDPWWNPAVEQQAQDRIHRLGQYKPIRVVRFVIANTIEERILKLQEKKQLVFEGTVGGSSEALGKLTEDDLRFLFKN